MWVCIVYVHAASGAPVWDERWRAENIWQRMAGCPSSDSIAVAAVETTWGAERQVRDSEKCAERARRLLLLLYIARKKNGPRAAPGPCRYESLCVYNVYIIHASNARAPRTLTHALSLSPSLSVYSGWCLVAVWQFAPFVRLERRFFSKGSVCCLGCEKTEVRGMPVEGRARRKQASACCWLASS